MHADAKLRIGIVLASKQVPSWQVALMRTMLDSADFHVQAWIARPAAAVLTRQSLLYKAFQRIEDRQRVDVPDALSLHEVGNVRASGLNLEIRDTFVDDLEALAESIRSCRLDILVDLSGVTSTGGVEGLARLGQWHFESNDEGFCPPDGSMAGFPEVMRRDACFSVSLRIVTADRSREFIAYQTVSAVNPRSHHLTCNELLWKCSAFPSRALNKMRELGTDSFFDSLLQAPRAATCDIKLDQPWSLARYVSWRIAQKIANRRGIERWILLWRRPTVDAANFNELAPPPGRFWADPHVVESGGVEHVFFEDASCRTGKGHIAVMTHVGAGRFSTPVPVIERHYHLSYPFVFEWRGDYFMIPESAENRTIELYRCARMPDRWEFMYNLMEDVRAFDATLLEHDGRWWMFANVAEVDGASSWDELCIFHAESPISRQWRPHRGNPVISNVRTSRPAGRFFQEGGRLIRPSQDSSGRYGRALNFSEIQELSTTNFREATIRRLEPGWESTILAVHSYSQAGELMFIDAVRRDSQ